MYGAYRIIYVRLYRDVMGIFRVYGVQELGALFASPYSLVRIYNLLWSH